ncbi:DUF1501 domain-containing protein [Myxococcus sp. CA039A]|uniref:DUF1501 domain-containing protein n=1 Tax=Myxococcus sp. CA039A TaxID=2741737 RepID=UPI00157A96D1|nr:DUF1501 domain-containing protein [Myxococcus sp. CA039A]NTX55790.1 DUF1501 domain-containing protein [Myxococcus sp. CA039A]
MARSSRREVLQALAGVSGLALLPACGLHRAGAPDVKSTSTPPVALPPPSTARPHYFVRITLDGGFDSVMTVDAKDPATAGEVDTGYRAAERLQGTRRLFGPLIGGLLRHDDALCLVHGVRYDTVAHETGEAILRAGHQRHGASTPPFGDVLGGLLPGSAPIPHLHIQTGFPRPPRPLDALPLPGNPEGRAIPLAGGLSIDPATVELLTGEPRRGLFDTPPWFEEMQALRHEEARQWLGGRPEELAAHEQTLQQGQHLQRLLSTADRHTALRGSPLGPGLQLAFHAVRGNHARFVTVRSPRVWLDTHTDNVALQSARTRPIFDDIAGFLDLLQRERNAFGTLLEQTTVVIASELGRFPKLNMVRGKDHWPENSWILLGRGIRAGATVGQTDARFRGVSIDYRSGSATEGQRRPLEIDALFATLLHLAGGDPLRHDYGRDMLLHGILA